MSVRVSNLELVREEFRLSCGFRAPRGITVLFGPSGAGKSTVLRCLAGLERPASGTVRVGEEVWLDSDADRFVPCHRRRVGMVFQESALFPHLTVRENLAYGWRRAGRPGGDRELGAMLRRMGLAGMESRRPGSLSGGERQRVALGRALLRDPLLLLLDEPLGALDREARSGLLTFLEERLRRLEIPVVYVTHSLPEALRLADRVIRLEGGRIAAEGDVESMAPKLGSGDRLGVVLIGRDPRWNPDRKLTEIETDAGRLRIPGRGSGRTASPHLRIEARDVSVALEPPVATSILNVLSGRIEAVRKEDGEEAVLEIRVGQALLLSRITGHSLHELELREGMEVYVQVKAVAVLG